MIALGALVNSQASLPGMGGPCPLLPKSCLAGVEEQLSATALGSTWGLEVIGALSSRCHELIYPEAANKKEFRSVKSLLWGCLCQAGVSWWLVLRGDGAGGVLRGEEPDPASGCSPISTLWPRLMEEDRPRCCC